MIFESVDLEILSWNSVSFTLIQIAATFDIIFVHNDGSVGRIIFALSVLHGIDKKRVDSANKYNKRHDREDPWREGSWGSSGRPGFLEVWKLIWHDAYTVQCFGSVHFIEQISSSEC